jgi:hypothetical protein
MRHLAIVPSSLGSLTRDFYSYRDAGPAAKLFSSLPSSVTIVDVSVDWLHVATWYIDTAATPMGHLLHAKADGTGFQEIVFAPGPNAAGQIFAGVSLDGKTVWYVSDITTAAPNWTGTLHLVPVDGTAPTTFTVGGYGTTTAINFQIDFASKGAAGIAWAGGAAADSIAFSGGSSAHVPAQATNVPVFAGSSDGKHLYYQDQAGAIDHLDVAARTANQLGTTTWQYISGTFAAYYVGATGALLRLPGDAGGPQTLATSGAINLQTRSDPFEEEIDYGSAQVGTGTGATDYSILGDLCGPGDKEFCNITWPR